MIGLTASLVEMSARGVTNPRAEFNSSKRRPNVPIGVRLGVRSRFRWEIYDFVFQRHLVLVRLRRFRVRQFPPEAAAHYLERWQRVRQSLRAQRRTRILDVKMQMRLGRVSRIADQAHDLAAPHLVAQLDAQRPRL